MNLKLCKQLRKNFRGTDPVVYNARTVQREEVLEKVRIAGEYTTRGVTRNVLLSKVHQMPANVEGYFWKPRTPAFDGMRNVLMPITHVASSGKARYRRMKRLFRGKYTALDFRAEV